LTETWLDQDKQQLINIDGYDIHFSNRKSRLGGGVCILSSTRLAGTFLSAYTSKTLSTIWILIHINTFRPLIVGCIYHPPKADQSTTQEHITDTMAKLTPTYPNAKYVITGDFNRLPVNDLCTQLGLSNLVKFHTRNDVTLDLILSDISEYENAVKLAPLSNNDHCCILVKGKQIHRSYYAQVTRRLVTIGRKAALLSELASTSWDNLKKLTCVHQKVSLLHDTINQLLDKHCPVRTTKLRSDRPVWITSTIRKLIKARDKAYTKGCSSYKFLRALTQKVIRSSKRQFVRNQLNNTNRTKEWWKLIKALTNPNKAKPVTQYTIINGERLTNEQLSRNLNSYYKSVGGEAIAIDTDFYPAANVPPLQPINIGEVKHLLNQLDTTKATSTDDFPTWISKEGFEDICIPVHDILNCMLSTCQYPNLWKKAQISPIPKISLPTVYKDFRPVSLLYHLGKVAEQVVIGKLRSQLQNVIKRHQFAYLPGLGTTDAILQLVDDCTAELDKKDSKYVQLACLDFSKAFDKLQPALLLRKLSHYGINWSIIKILEDFLKHRQQCVKVKDTISEYINISVGAPQGTKLGPILWLFYVNDLTADNSNIVQYADDTSFYKTIRYPDTESIAPEILRTQHWSDTNKMVLNAEKTVIINISINYRHTYEQPISFNNLRITPSPVVKFLGVYLDNHLHFSANVDNIIARANFRLHCLRQLKTLGLNSSGLCTFYFTHIRSILTYAAPAWFFLLSEKDKDRLEKIQRTATRIITPNLEYVDRLNILEMPLLSTFIFTLGHNHFYRILHNPNHPLHNRILVNTNRTSSRQPTLFKAERARTSKRSNSFFNFFMSTNSKNN
jgi:hypothetical protein